MKIAYISYEHPLGVSGGGIGTYTDQIAAVMADRGHEVEVFSSNKNQETLTIKNKNYLLHLLSYDKASNFKENVLSVFGEREAVTGFDIVESPEYSADALLIKKKYSQITLILKLHTPSFLVSRLNDNLSILKKVRFVVSGLLKGQIPELFWKYNKAKDLEYEQYLIADGAYSPSNSLKTIITKEWGDKEIDVIPNPFIPQPQLLTVSQNHNATLQVTFLGRLEKRKGILDLMRAIPIVLRTHQVTFNFVGQPLDSPIKGKKMDEYLKEELQNFKPQLLFRNEVNYEEIPDIFNNTDICVFPSLWENFPTVCLEAMAAGKVVIGTNNGGMRDMITDGVTGVLIPPHSPQRIADAILSMVEHRDKLADMGQKAREKLLSNFNSETIGQLTENFYRKINPNVS